MRVIYPRYRISKSLFGDGLGDWWCNEVQERWAWSIVFGYLHSSRVSRSEDNRTVIAARIHFAQQRGQS